MPEHMTKTPWRRRAARIALGIVCLLWLALLATCCATVTHGVARMVTP